MEMAKDYPNSYLKSDVLLLAGDVFDKETWKFINYVEVIIWAQQMRCLIRPKLRLNLF